MTQATNFLRVGKKFDWRLATHLRVAIVCHFLSCNGGDL
jgi:hypothetical protein